MSPDARASYCDQVDIHENGKAVELPHARRRHQQSHSEHGEHPSCDDRLDCNPVPPAHRGGLAAQRQKTLGIRHHLKEQTPPKNRKINTPTLPQSSSVRNPLATQRHAATPTPTKATPSRRIVRAALLWFIPGLSVYSDASDTIPVPLEPLPPVGLANPRSDTASADLRVHCERCDIRDTCWPTVKLHSRVLAPPNRSEQLNHEEPG